MKLEAMLRAALVALSLAAVALPAPAAADSPRFELSAFSAYRIGGEFKAEEGAFYDLRDGASWGLGLGLYRDPEGFYELLYSRRSAGLSRAAPELAGLDVTIEYLHFGGTLLLPQPRGETGYVSLTAGITRLATSGGGYDTERNLSASIGGGLRIPLGERVHAALGVRAYLTMVDSSGRLVCASIDGEGSCLLRVSGRNFWELEAQAGLGFRF